MRCAFCGLQFDPEEARVGCHGCALAGSCRMVRCPRCGYESPPEARLLALIRRWGRHLSGAFGKR